VIKDSFNSLTVFLFLFWFRAMRWGNTRIKGEEEAEDIYYF
jgi:hypothetical protein